MCGSNNYLGLTCDPRVRDAAKTAVDRYGTSCTGSRLLNGNLDLHEELEHELAQFFGTEAAAVFPTGYQANLGVLYALLGRGDYVVLDSDDHASLIDGARISRANLRRFRHNDPASLEEQLRAIPAGAGILVVVDGVYSMEGDIADLPALAEVCRRYGAGLLVDDAHGAGVLAQGRGTAAHFRMTDQVDLISLTFSKAFASIGGAVLGPERVINYLKHASRPMLFSAGASPASTAAALTALRVLRAEPWRCERVLAIARRVHGALRELGFNAGASSTPVVPVLLGRPGADDLTNLVEVFAAQRRLLDLGVYVNPVPPPAASYRLRTSFMATHTDEQIQQVIDAFAVLAGEGLGVTR
ncbi:aminotransferase class I/II-fold pyridoxal phosphate-dependent enzyme [Bailinhaonella thermotolerans]|uniref:8-amino-7-oxononanoate synthase n=2 Tax=Bailinhaonella thermotolerans TaxID=1070861 RepID=A0A3A4AB69_9ACTN|nr:aminotransferase class I/II-fold pyridoxal phosphate-dependent enzyme [Bailinhaonella thermotolerans]